LIFLRTTVLDAACTGQRVNNIHLLFSLSQQLFVIIPMPSALSMPLALLTGRLTEKELLVGMMTSKLPLLHARAVSCTQPASHARTEAGDVPISKENAHARAVSCTQPASHARTEAGMSQFRKKMHMQELFHGAETIQMQSSVPIFLLVNALMS
jgi:hypothetical protein